MERSRLLRIHRIRVSILETSVQRGSQYLTMDRDDLVKIEEIVSDKQPYPTSTHESKSRSFRGLFS